MRTKALLIIVLTSILMLALTSCKPIVNWHLKAFEKSVNKLEQNYKDLTPNQLERAVGKCDIQLEWLVDHKDNFTINQRKKFRELKIRYYWLLHYSISGIDLSEEYESVVGYIKDIIDELKESVDELLP